MKKAVHYFIFVVGIVGLLLSSCRTLKFVADENYPSDQSTTICFKGGSDVFGFLITKWNGIDIEDNLYGKLKVWTGNDQAVLIIPSGNSKITFNAVFYANYFNYKIKNIELEYNFESKKKYEIKRTKKTKGMLFNKSYEFFIGVYDITKGSILLKEWKVGESN